MNLSLHKSRGYPDISFWHHPNTHSHTHTGVYSIVLSSTGLEEHYKKTHMM